MALKLYYNPFSSFSQKTLTRLRSSLGSSAFSARSWRGCGEVDTVSLAIRARRHAFLAVLAVIGASACAPFLGVEDVAYATDAGADAVSAGDAGLLAGGDFEAPGPGCGSWTAYRAIVSRTTDNPHSGSGACLVCESAGLGLIDVDVYLSMTLSMPRPVPQTPYRISAWWRLATETNTSAKASVEVSTTQDDGGVTTTESTPSTGAPTWQEITLHLVVPPGTASIDKVALHGMVASGTCFAVDDFVMQEGP